MKNEITVNGITYEFFFDERLNMWRLIESESLIDNYAVDIEVDLANLNGEIEWINIEKFIEFICDNKQKVNENIEDAQYLLLALFKSINKKVYDEVFLNNINFIPSGIDYKGFCKNVNLRSCLKIKS